MKKLFFSALVGIALASCSTGKGYIADANAQLNLTRDNLEISKVITAEAKQTLIFGIDFKRLFKADVAYVNQAASGTYIGAGFGGFNIPILGQLSRTSVVEGYTYAKLLSDNQGYDCIIYPKYSQKTKNIVGIIVKTTGKVEARLAKIK